MAKRAESFRLAAHIERHVAENGADGVWFGFPQSVDDVLATYSPRLWVQQTTASQWQRVWLWTEDGEARGHCSVTGNAVAPHRCTLSAGVESGWRGRGIGRAVMSAALTWLRAQDGLRWVDGGAFAHNERVLHLDRSVGFVERCVIEDACRVGSQSFDQVVLVLDLKSGG